MLLQQRAFENLTMVGTYNVLVFDSEVGGGLEGGANHNSN